MSRGEKIAFVLAAVALAVACFVGALVGIGNQRRDAALGRIERPRPARAQSSNSQAGNAAARSNAAAVESVVPAKSFGEVFDQVRLLEDRADWSEAFKLLYDSGTVWRELSEEQKATLRALITSLDGLIAEIRATAAQGGPIRELDLSKGYALELPHLALTRELARLLRMDALIAADTGDLDRVIDDLVAMTQLSAALNGEPLTISHLVRVAISGMTFEAFGETLPATGLSPEQSGRLLGLLAADESRDAFPLIYGSEADAAALAFQDAQPFWGDADRTDRFLLRLYTSPLGRPLASFDEAYLMEFLAELQSLARMPYYEARPRIEALQQQTADISRLRVFSSVILPRLVDTLQAQARHEATLNLMQLGLIIEFYRAETETCPDDLGAIGNRVPGGLPLDPFSGQPYMYRRAGDGFVLYSVGVNGIDDGGRYDYGDGDITWRGHEEPQRPAEKSLHVAKA